MINKLREIQLSIQKKFNDVATTNKAILIVMANAAIVSSNKGCINNLLDPNAVEQIVFNSCAILLLVDIRLLNFLKLFVAGGIAHVITSQSISLYTKFFTKQSNNCELPIYIESYFNIFIVITLFIGAIYWLFQGNEKRYKEILSKSKIGKDKDFDYG